MSISATAIDESPREVSRWHDLWTSLKIGTCLTSSWVTTAAATLAATYSFDTPGKLFFGAMTLIGGVALTNLGLSLNPKPVIRPPSETERKVNQFSEMLARSKEVAHFFKRKEAPTFHFLDEDEVKTKMNWLGFQWGSHAFINKQRYNQLNPGERVFTVVHEFAHACRMDNVSKLLGHFSRMTALTAVPVSAVGIVTSFGTEQMPLASAFAAAAGVMFGASCVLYSRAKQIMERRADDFYVMVTHDPISAISATDKIQIHEERNVFQSLLAENPTREERILNIVESFNKRWPDHKIDMVLSSPGQGGRRGEIVLDASKLNERRYILRNQGFSADEAAFGMA